MTQQNLFDDPGLAQVDWTGTRDAGLARLRAFVPNAGRAYAARRNADLGPGDRSNISCLSPWIRHGLIDEEEVLRATLARHAPSTAEKFVQEVFWRAYFKGWLEQHPSVWASYVVEKDQQLAELDHRPVLNADYCAAIEGRTGIDCMDAWARELVTTGYLHNHTRMWFASIWTFTLHLPWQLGADFFMRHLMDADAAANTCSWRWVVGLHTKGKVYAARQANIEHYTEERFAPAGLTRDPQPLVEAEGHPLVPLPQAGPPLDTDHIAVLTDEDCRGAALPLGPGTRAILSLPPAMGGKRPAQLFRNAASADGLRLAQSAAPNAAAEQAQGDWAEAMIAAARRHRLSELLVAWPTVGPTRDRLDAAEPRLAAEGLRLHRIMRPYDAACWPHATRGFFKLRAKIPTILAQLSIDGAR